MMQTGMGLLDYDEASKFIGLSAFTLRKYVSLKRIPFIKIGDRVFFDPARLREWVDERRVEPAR
jgi:excisionase family DNA binding protein